MYTILLVEDEAIVRKGIAENTDWPSYGFSLIGACADGREAISFLGEQAPDVVITDINMPHVNGLELAAHIDRLFPAVLTVMLTGFSEFHYAQQALKLHVADYILKPISPTELKELLIKLKEELDRRKKVAEEVRRLQSQAIMTRSILYSAFLNELIQKPQEETFLLKSAALKEVVFEADWHMACIFEPDDTTAAHAALSGAPKDTVGFVIANIAAEVIGALSYCHCAPTDASRTLLIVSGNSQEECLSRTRACVPRIQSTVKEYVHFTIAAGAGGPGHGLTSVYHSAQAALHALGYRFVMGENAFLQDEALRAAEQDENLWSLFLEPALLTALRQCEETTAVDLVTSLFQAIKHRTLHRDAAQPTIERLRHALIEICTELDLFEDPVLKACRLFESAPFQDVDVYAAAMCDACRHIVQCNQSYLDDPAKKCAIDAEGYIQHNLSDSEMTLTTLITRLCVSKSYFSNVFKAHTGMTFVEYLTKTRMERAKGLLRTTAMRTYEIAEKVGFTDAHYFSVTFKRYAGVTPKEYREARK